MDFRRYQPLAKRQVIFLSALSRLRTWTAGLEIPFHQDFHLGGKNSVRGWNRDIANGKNESISTVEYRYRVVEPHKILKGKFGNRLFIGFEMALFADAGSVWGNSTGPDKGKFMTGYGIGLSLLMPFVNVIRLDFAMGESGEGIITHFGVTPKTEKQRQRIH